MMKMMMMMIIIIIITMSIVKCSCSIFQFSLNITVRPGVVIDRIQFYPKAVRVSTLTESCRNKPGRNESKQLRCCKDKPF